MHADIDEAKEVLLRLASRLQRLEADARELTLAVARFDPAEVLARSVAIDCAYAALHEEQGAAAAVVARAHALGDHARTALRSSMQEVTRALRRFQEQQKVTRAVLVDARALVAAHRRVLTATTTAQRYTKSATVTDDGVAPGVIHSATV